MNITSPDISVLEYNLLYDISGATPVITFTNQSTGAHLNSCTWWVELRTPSSTPIHIGTQASPDRTGVWSTFVIPEAWPLFNGQIEFSCSAPYSAILFVKDSLGNVFQLQKTQTICRPNGSTSDSIGNFGKSDFSVSVKCNDGNIYAQDNTNYAYQTLLGVRNSQSWKLVYPMDENGNIPSPVTVTNKPSVLFAVGYSSDGYQLYLNSIYDYAFPNNVTVRLQYKNRDFFAVWCNIDLCPLVCEINKLYERLSTDCSISEEPGLKDKLLKINTKLNLCIIGIQQPLCGIDVASLVKEIQVLGGFTCNCTSGVNGSNPSAAFNFAISGVCGDIRVIDFSQVGNNVTVTLGDNSYIFKVCDSIPTTAFTVTPTTEGCIKTFCLNVDLNQLKTDLNIGAFASFLPVYERGSGIAPINCPLSYFPANVYDVTGVSVIGLANNVDDLISILNANGGWFTKATAFEAGHCKIGFIPKAGQTLPSQVYVQLVTVGVGPCVNNTKTYPINVIDYCNGKTLPFLSFPFRGWISYDGGATKVPLNLVANPKTNAAITDYDTLVTKMNAEPGRPVNISYGSIAGNQNAIGIVVYDVNCSFSTPTIIVYADIDHTLLYGANNQRASLSGAALMAVWQGDNSVVGKVANVNNANFPFHILKVKNFLFYAESNTGNVMMVDMSNPLQPIVAGCWALTPVAGSPVNFSGIPNSPPLSGTATYWDLYFITNYNPDNERYIYVVESLSGTIWQIDISVPTTTVAVDGFRDTRLIGKCPRIMLGGLILFSQDGYVETITAQSSGIASNVIVKVDTSQFSTHSSCVATIGMTYTLTTNEYVYAMSFDGTQYVYATTNKGTIIKFLIVDNNNTPNGQFGQPISIGYTIYTNALGGSLLIDKYANSVYWLGKLYICTFGQGTFIFDVNTQVVTTFETFQPEGSSAGPDLKHWNFLPMPGKCYGYLTYNVTVGKSGVVKFTLDGKIMEFTYNTTAGQIFYNVLAYTVEAKTPTTLV